MDQLRRGSSSESTAEGDPEPGTPDSSALRVLRAATREARRTARMIPGVRTVEAIAGSAERFVLAELKHRLEELEGPKVESHPPPPSVSPPRAEGATATESLRTIADTM